MLLLCDCDGNLCTQQIWRLGSTICPVVTYDLHRDSAIRIQVCDTVQKYETFGCYSVTI